MPDFISGLDLSERFYHEAVRPILDARFPGLAHSAALVGDGSDVLGYDDAMSTDHDWGPRLLLFLREEEAARHSEALHRTLAERLPRTFLGYSTHFSLPGEDGSSVREEAGAGPINHRVRAVTIKGFIQGHLGCDPDSALTPAGWLTFGEQKLLAVTAGRVFHDGLGLEAVRARFAYYPRDVWLYLLASGWMWLAQEEHLMPRAGYRGDELGSALIGARLVHNSARLCFLMERTYAPYPKWFGTAFARLKCAPTLLPLLNAALRAGSGQAREAALSRTDEHLAAMHNALGLTEALPTAVHGYYNRPFQVLDAGRFARALWEQITDPAVRAVLTHVAPDDGEIQGRFIGAVDQFSHSTDLLWTQWRAPLRGLYGP